MKPSSAIPKLRDFDYEQAFDRNIGWLSREEQARLKNACVAIAGLGGAGGYQVQALSRLGVGAFKIADLDSFELSNTNRQMGASQETLGRPKVEVLKEMILQINPEAKVRIYGEGFHAGNKDDFLDGVNVALDGIDFFAADAKMLFFDTCFEKKVTSPQIDKSAS